MVSFIFFNLNEIIFYCGGLINKYDVAFFKLLPFRSTSIETKICLDWKGAGAVCTDVVDNRVRPVSRWNLGDKEQVLCLFFNQLQHVWTCLMPSISNLKASHLPLDLFKCCCQVCSLVQLDKKSPKKHNIPYIYCHAAATATQLWFI